MFNKIKAIKDLRDQAKQMQNKLSEVIIEGSSAGVTIKMDGNQQILNISISDELVGHKEKLESAIKSAFEDVTKKLHKQMAVKMKEMGGLDALKNLGL